jgi:hypothetical protein
MKGAVAISCLLLSLAAGRAAGQQPATWPAAGAVEQIFGRPLTSLPAGVFIVRFPRIDLAVSVGEVRLKPPFALTSWVAFLPVEGGAVAMGDLVVTVEESAPVMRALQAGGVEVAAMHNHLLGEMPRIMYMHIMTRGDPARIASTVRAALALTGTPITAPMVPAPVPFPLDSAMLARALGVAGKINGGVFQVSVPRAGPILNDGVTLPPGMGLATVINIQPLDSLRAAATGDFVLTADQVTPLIRALTSHGFTVTAVHSHLTASTPTLLFVHFWVVDSARQVGEGLGAALAVTRK